MDKQTTNETPNKMMSQSQIFDFHQTQADVEAKQYEFSWILKADCPYLDGHFPGQPMLPAVATIDGSIELLKRALHAADLQPRAVFNAKFMAPITPGLNITVNLTCLAAPTEERPEQNKWQADWSTQTEAGEKTLLARIALAIPLAIPGAIPLAL